jgi:hypothetical protein
MGVKERLEPKPINADLICRINISQTLQAGDFGLAIPKKADS